MKQNNYFEGSEDHWKIDKKVPVALILTVLAQSIAFAFWFGGLDNRVSTLEDKDTAQANLPDRVTRLEERFKSMRDILRIEKTLDHVTRGRKEQ